MIEKVGKTMIEVTVDMRRFAQNAAQQSWLAANAIESILTLTPELTLRPQNVAKLLSFAKFSTSSQICSILALSTCQVMTLTDATIVLADSLG